ncbi:FtsX-like permease family protein [Panacibacter ginsenosidivorans]|uniref:FtsX-like permease family protein n=1 Tax=Panacibacter ginsenosidivorans TaxID=1813871 RepID=A0A5B8V472_9BACT|nr:ABC transporter permease [Panacibacter ginsenosidivorans]QEC65978.1 FtsX-like permease family protein [Panacibacter ginsenosidivorans]
MIRNYFKIAWRNLMKYKFISFVNLFGLTVGLTCCLLIATYIINELSYDKYNKNAENIYRVTRSFNNQDGVVSLNLSTVSPPFGYYLPGDFPEIKKMTRLLNTGTLAIKYGEKIINEPNVYFADENLFNVFTLDVLKGDPNTALKDPFSVMLSEDVAKKYFGNEDPINKVLRVSNKYDVKVTGIYKGFPANSHMHPGTLLSFNTLKDSAIYGAENLRTNWGNNSFFTYLLLPDHYDPQKMVARFPAFIDAHMNRADYNGQLPSKFTTLGLQKLTDIHLYSHTDYEAEPNGDINRVYIFSAIALFILLIACINYMNLSSARSALRAREIGIRKVMGAGKKGLIFQFLSESVLIAWVAILMAFALLYFTLPLLNQLSGLELSVEMLLKWQVIVPLLLTPFVVGILSGLYPALFMSSFQPVKTLKGLFKIDGSNISFRKILVVAQFTISIVLIITTIIVFQQLKYMQNTSLGYDKDHIITLPYINDLNPSYETFRNELLQSNAVKNVTRSSRVPTGRLLDAMGASTFTGDSAMPVTSDIKFVVADYDFVSTYDIQIAAGRNFSRQYGTDTSNFILNEAAVKAIGWKSAQDALGKDFRYASIKGKIIGVVKDFHFESLHQQIVPMVLVNPANAATDGYFNFLSLQVAGNNIQSTLKTIEKTWKKYLPEVPYQATFLDETYSQLYVAEQKQGTIFTIFSCIAIFIACLGLFGLSAFAITQRVKEIGVRKVLGASTSTIVSLLSKDFLKLVLIAAVIAFPVAWYAMYNWLQDFAYRINIQWWVFIIAALLALIIALATISFQAIKAAIANPVKSLRSE